MPKPITSNDVRDAIALAEWAKDEGKPAEVVEHLRALATKTRLEYQRQNKETKRA